MSSADQNQNLSPAANDYFPAPGMDGWRANSDPDFVRSLGIDPAGLADFLDYNMTNWPNQGGANAAYRSCLVIKDGWIIGERYSRPDARQYKQYISSNGKAYAIAMFAIMASEHGVSLSDKVYDRRWLSEGFPLSDPRKSEITFEQIIRHTSGICPESTHEKGRNKWSDYVGWVVGHDGDWADSTARLAFDPGSDEAYSSVAFCHIGLVVKKITGMCAHDYLWSKILEPTGVSSVGWQSPPDPEGGHMWFSAGGIQITPRDYARFGWLLMNKGRWEKEQLIPAEILEYIMADGGVANLMTFTKPADRTAEVGLPADTFRIAGSGLNWLYAVPSRRLICLRTSRVKNELWREIERNFVAKMAAMLTR